METEKEKWLLIKHQSNVCGTNCPLANNDSKLFGLLLLKPFCGDTDLIENTSFILLFLKR